VLGKTLAPHARAAKASAMSEDRIYTAALAVIGDEILSGRTQDKNIAQIALWLNLQGIRLAEVRVVPDVEEAIIEAVNQLRARKAVAVLESYYETRGGATEARLRMARVPEGASLIENRMSGAPGIRHGNVFIMAGVPHITAMMLEALSGSLEGGKPLISETLGCWVAESEVAELLRTTEKAHEGCQIGSYPFFRDGRVGANFVVRSTEPDRLAACIAALDEGLRATGRETVSGGV
jgi:molybdopterin-biosynthesis enzyme MoeA-like protein